MFFLWSVAPSTITLQYDSLLPDCLASQIWVGPPISLYILELALLEWEEVEQCLLHNQPIIAIKTMAKKINKYISYHDTHKSKSEDKIMKKSPEKVWQKFNRSSLTDWSVQRVHKGQPHNISRHFFLSGKTMYYIVIGIHTILSLYSFH